MIAGAAHSVPGGASRYTLCLNDSIGVSYAL